MAAEIAIKEEIRMEYPPKITSCIRKNEEYSNREIRTPLTELITAEDPECRQKDSLIRNYSARHKSSDPSKLVASDFS